MPFRRILRPIPFQRPRIATDSSHQDFPWNGSLLILLSRLPILQEALKTNGTRNLQLEEPDAKASPSRTSLRAFRPGLLKGNHAARNRVWLTVLVEALAAGDRDIVPLFVDALNTKSAVSHGLNAACVALCCSGVRRCASR